MSPVEAAYVQCVRELQGKCPECELFLTDGIAGHEACLREFQASIDRITTAVLDKVEFPRSAP